MAAVQPGDEGFGHALDGVGPGLAERVTTGDVGIDHRVVELGKGHVRDREGMGPARM